MRKEVDRVNQKHVTKRESAGGDALETMHAIVHLYRSQQLRGLRAGAHELAHMEVRTLMYFARNPGSTQTELVTHSGRDKAQVARLIKGLRDAGLLDAVADVADRRSTHLSLSEAGREVCASLRRHNDALAEVALAGISDAEKAELMSLLGRVRANLKAHEDR
jgi:DNA-binding MarR family transcriptional regulator